jgi:ribosome maturation factor RimP
LQRRIIEGLGDKKSPILLIIKMITEEKIRSLIEEILSDDMFIVRITIGSGNAIAVSVDSDYGINIDKCVEISRHIEQNLDRETEDFSLEVSSPGLTQPLRVLRQYYKNIGRKIEVMTNSGEKHEGILNSVDKGGFELEVSNSKRVKGTESQTKRFVGYSFDQIKTVKLLISLK